jgi:hypothetical protein
MIRGASLPIGEIARRLWADPRFRRVVMYLGERALRKLIDLIEKKLTAKRKQVEG